jgi:hypothetical protein
MLRRAVPVPCVSCSTHILQVVVEPGADHNSAMGGAAPGPPGGLQLPMQLKVDWTVEWLVFSPVQCAEQ